MEWLSDLCHLIVDEGKTPHDWPFSVPITAFKLGEPLECEIRGAIRSIA